MANDLELALRIRSDVQKALRDMREMAEGTRNVGRQAEGGARGLDRMAKSGERAGSVFRQLRGVLATIGIGLLVREVLRADDAYASLQGRLRLVVADEKQLARIEGELFQSAQRARASYEGTVDLYARLARSTQALKVSEDELLEVTETINQSIVVSGANSQAASAALFQLGQGFASGALRGEELNSVLEQTPRLAQAIADGLGITIGELRKMGAEGKLTSAAVFGALRNQRETLEREFQQMPRTVGQAMQQLANDFQRAAAAGDLSPLVEAIDDLRELVSDPVFIENMGHLISGVARLVQLGAQGAEKFASFGRKLGEFAGRVVAGPLHPSFDEPPSSAGAAPSAPKKTTPPPPAVGGGEDKETKAARESLENLNESLRTQIETFDTAESFVLAYRLSLGDLAADVARLGPEGEKVAASIVAQAQVLEELEAQKQADAEAEKARMKEAEEAERRRQELLDEGASLTERVRTAEEQHVAELARYNELLKEGAISQETYNRAVAASAKAYEEAKKRAQDAGDGMDQYAIQAARNIQSHFADFLFDPFEDGLDGMLRGFVDVIRRMIAEAAAAQLAKHLFGDLASGGTPGGLIGSFLAGLFHEGGIVGEGGATRRVSPALFLGAPRLHDGLAPDEFPAILQAGEEVLAKDDPRNAANGGGSTRIVNVLDPALVQDYLTSSDGERVLVNVIQRNKGSIKQVLA